MRRALRVFGCAAEDYPCLSSIQAEVLPPARSVDNKPESEAVEKARTSHTRGSLALPLRVDDPSGSAMSSDSVCKFSSGTGSNAGRENKKSFDTWLRQFGPAKQVEISLRWKQALVRTYNHGSPSYRLHAPS